MSKPWDNEPTPQTDAEERRHKAELLNQPYDSEETSFVVGIETGFETSRKLERRMRAAERLLESKMCRRECGCCKEAKAHLKAAKKEDGR